MSEDQMLAGIASELNPAIPANSYLVWSTPQLLSEILNAVEAGGGGEAGGIGHPVNIRDFGADPAAADNTAAIQSAIDTGVPVYIPPGTFKVQSLNLPTGTKIYGAGTLRAVDAFANDILVAAANATDIAIEGITIDCNGTARRGYSATGASAARHKILNCRIRSSTEDAIRLASVVDCHIAGNFIETAGQHGVAFTIGASGFIVAGNQINNPGGAGVIFSVGTKGTIVNNVITAPGPNGDGVTGYHADNFNVSIVGNTIIDSANHGIHIGGDNLTVVGNTIINSSTNDGIFIHATDTGSSGGASVTSENATVNSNTIVTSGRAAIEIQNVDGGSVCGNTVKASTDHQILLVLSNTLSVRDNILRDGTLSGIVVRGTVDSTISDNTISGHAAGNGVRVEVSGATQSTGNTVRDNTIDGCTTGVAEANSSNNNRFSNNRVRNASVQTFSRVGATSGWDSVEVIGKANTAVSHTGTVTETTLATIPLPGAGAMGANGTLEIEAFFSYPNTANNKTLRVKLGGTVVQAAVLTTTSRFRFYLTVANRNAMNSQVVGTLIPGNSATSGLATTAIDTSGQIDVTLTAELANTGETIILEYYTVKLLR